MPQFQFRFLFALGAIPALVLLGFTRRRPSETNTESREAQPLQNRSGEASKQDDAPPPPDRYVSAPGHAGDLSEMLHTQPGLMRTLLGTSSTWCLFDIVLYGTEIFTPKILDDICLSGRRTALESCRQTFVEVAFQGGVVTGLGVPGLATALCLVDRWGCRCLNCVGFLALAVNFAAMATVAHVAPDEKRLLFGLFCAHNYLLKFGPNLATYVLPAISFPTEIRSTCHGISAFAGKLGAVIGALLFPLIEGTWFGLSGAFLLQAMVCTVGATVSLLLLKPDVGQVEVQQLPSAIPEEPDEEAEVNLKRPPRASLAQVVGSRQEE